MWNVCADLSQTKRLKIKYKIRNSNFQSFVRFVWRAEFSRIEGDDVTAHDLIVHNFLFFVHFLKRMESSVDALAENLREEHCAGVWNVCNGNNDNSGYYFVGCAWKDMEHTMFAWRGVAWRVRLIPFCQRNVVFSLSFATLNQMQIKGSRFMHTIWQRSDTHKDIRYHIVHSHIQSANKIFVSHTNDESFAAQRKCEQIVIVFRHSRQYFFSSIVIVISSAQQ